VNGYRLFHFQTQVLVARFRLPAGAKNGLKLIDSVLLWCSGSTSDELGIAMVAFPHKYGAHGIQSVSGSITLIFFDPDLARFNYFKFYFFICNYFLILFSFYIADSEAEVELV
jgi:hypothetical protein